MTTAGTTRMRAYAHLFRIGGFPKGNRNSNEAVRKSILSMTTAPFNLAEPPRSASRLPDAGEQMR
jgi:hypothetical protein